MRLPSQCLPRVIWLSRSVVINSGHITTLSSYLEWCCHMIVTTFSRCLTHAMILLHSISALHSCPFLILMDPWFIDRFDRTEDVPDCLDGCISLSPIWTIPVNQMIGSLIIDGLNVICLMDDRGSSMNHNERLSMRSTTIKDRRSDLIIDKNRTKLKINIKFNKLKKKW